MNNDLQSQSLLMKVIKNYGFIFIFVILVIFLILGILLLRSRETVVNLSAFCHTDIGDGWTTYESNNSPRFAISLPTTWKVTADLNINNLQEKAANVDNPQLSELLKSDQGRETIQCCLKFLANDPRSASGAGFHTNINIGVYPQDHTIGFDGFLDQTIKDEQQMGVPVESSRINTQAGQTGVIKTEVGATLPSGKKIGVFEIQFLFFRDHSGLAVTIACPQEGADANSQTFDRIGQSFKWLQ